MRQKIRDFNKKNKKHIQLFSRIMRYGSLAILFSAFCLFLSHLAWTVYSGPPSCPTIQPAQLLPDPCVGLSLEQCNERKAFLKKNIRASVSVYVPRFHPVNGMKYFNGSGVVINEKGWVLTAHHVVEDAYMDVVHVTYRDLQAYYRYDRSLLTVPMTVARSDKATDCALLIPQTKLGIPDPIPLADKPIQRGDAIYQFGTVSKYSFGHVTSVSELTVTASLFAQYGDSGGAVVNPDGELVGLIAMRTCSDPSVGIFVPIQRIKSVLQLDFP